MEQVTPTNVVVFGGASGIGLATVRHYATTGANVTLVDLDLEQARQRATDIANEASGVIAAAVADVTDEDAVAAALASHVERFGNVDLVVNSAGTSTLVALADHDVSEFRRIVDVNLVGGLNVIKHAAKVLYHGGSIVNIASINARQAGFGQGAYCASKAGLVALTEVAALELGSRGIRVNAVSPGLLQTSLTELLLMFSEIIEDYEENTPVGRIGTTDDVVGAIAYAASAPWLSGANIDLNGGAHLRRHPDLLGHFARIAEGELES